MRPERFLEAELLNRLKTKPVTQIYVSDLIAGVGICKATFYKYYCDKYDLLQKCFYHEFYEEILAHAATFEQFAAASLSAFRKSPKTVVHAMICEDPSSIFSYHSGLVKSFLVRDRIAAGKETEGEFTGEILRIYADDVTRATVEWLSAPKLVSAEERMRLIRGLFPAALG